MQSLKVPVSISTNIDVSDRADDYAASILKKRKLNTNVSSKTVFLKSRFIRPTSNVLERFFSSAGVAYNDFRQGLSPVNLEMQLFLKFNSDLWDVETVSQLC